MDNQELREGLAKIRPSTLLKSTAANNLYHSVGTIANELKGIQMMSEDITDDDKIEMVAAEPSFGVMYSVDGGAKSPVSEKLSQKKEFYVTVDFKDSIIFDHKDLKAILRADKSNSNKAEIRLASKAIFTNIAHLKTKHQITKEMLFWDGCIYGKMSVPQKTGGVTSVIEIETLTRSMAALTSTDSWNYYLTNATGSTADPVLDIKKMKQSFTGKGSKLVKIYCNLYTFDTMVFVPKLRDTIQYTSARLETSGEEKITLAGVSVEVYDATYLNNDKVSTNFIPDGYIVGFGRNNDGMGNSIVKYVKGINIEVTAKLLGSESVDYVYGDAIYIRQNDDPVSKQIMFSNNGLPVFQMAQLIVAQKVFA